MSRRNLLFAVAQNALKGKAATLGVLEDLHTEVWELTSSDYDTEIIQTALMYPALLALPGYRDALENMLFAIHGDNQDDRNQERAERKYGSTS